MLPRSAQSSSDIFNFNFPERDYTSPEDLTGLLHKTIPPLTASHGEEIPEGFHSFVSAFIPQHEKGNQAKASHKKSDLDNRNIIKLKEQPWSCIHKTTAGSKKKTG